MPSREEELRKILGQFYHDYDLCFQAYCSEDGRLYGKEKAIDKTISAITNLYGGGE